MILAAILHRAGREQESTGVNEFFIVCGIFVNV